MPVGPPTCLKLCLRAFFWQAKLGRDVANIPIAVALIAIDKRAFNHLKRIEGECCRGEKPFCIAPIGEAQAYSLGIVRLHVQQWANLWACKTALPHGLLREIPAMRK